MARYMQQRYDLFFFFFQAEDGIRDVAVTGVQTCALPIFRRLQSLCDERLALLQSRAPRRALVGSANSPELRCSPKRRDKEKPAGYARGHQIGRASCRERV